MNAHLRRWLSALTLATLLGTGPALSSPALAGPSPSAPTAPAPSTSPAAPASPTPSASPTPGAAPSPAPSPSPSPSPEKVENHTYYQGYLKDPASLGFAPDQTLFDAVYSQIKAQHIDRDPDDKLFAGVAKEAAELLSQAKVSATDLESMPRTSQLPTLIQLKYRHKVDANLLWYAMIRGLLEGTGDPYTVLMTPHEYHLLMEQMQNESFGGIGIYIELDKEHGDVLTIVEPLEGTPALQAGLLSGDQILKINGNPTKGITLDMATAQIRGPVSKPVVLTIARPGTPEIKDYTIARAQIAASSVSRKMIGSTGYIRLRMFGARTGGELQEALRYVSSQGARGIVLDLRNNGGGYINAAVDVCSNFVNGGSLVTYTLDRRENRRDYSALGRTLNRLPMVLLVNGFSASASEITAGCLKDYHRATIVGTKSFGKGSVQQLYPLPNGAALKVTIAHFFTPQGNKINKVGVTPDVISEMEPRMVGRGDKDTQLDKAVKVLGTLTPAP